MAIERLTLKLLKERRVKIQELEKQLLDLKITCPHRFEEKDEAAICAGCDWIAGWWCPESPTNVCSYDEGDCIYCGEPESRP